MANTKLVAAVLIAAVALGLLYFFFLAPIFSTCYYTSPGYLCRGATYNIVTGNLTVTIGQNTGASWTGWGVAYAPLGSPINYHAMNGPLASGQTKTITLPVATGGISTHVNIWVCYTTIGAGVVGGMGSCIPTGGVGTSEVYYAEIANLTVNA